MNQDDLQGLANEAGRSQHFRDVLHVFVQDFTQKQAAEESKIREIERMVADTSGELCLLRALLLQYQAKANDDHRIILKLQQEMENLQERVKSLDSKTNASDALSARLEGRLERLKDQLRSTCDDTQNNVSKLLANFAKQQMSGERKAGGPHGRSSNRTRDDGFTKPKTTSSAFKSQSGSSGKKSFDSEERNVRAPKNTTNDDSTSTQSKNSLVSSAVTLSSSSSSSSTLQPLSDIKSTASLPNDVSNKNECSTIENTSTNDTMPSSSVANLTSDSVLSGNDDNCQLQKQSITSADHSSSSSSSKSDVPSDNEQTSAKTPSTDPVSSDNNSFFDERPSNEESPPETSTAAAPPASISLVKTSAAESESAVEIKTPIAKFSYAMAAKAGVNLSKENSTCNKVSSKISSSLQDTAPPLADITSSATSALANTASLIDTSSSDETVSSSLPKSPSLVDRAFSPSGTESSTANKESSLADSEITASSSAILSSSADDATFSSADTPSVSAKTAFSLAATTPLSPDAAPFTTNLTSFSPSKSPTGSNGDSRLGCGSLPPSGSSAQANIQQPPAKGGNKRQGFHKGNRGRKPRGRKTSTTEEAERTVASTTRERQESQCSAGSVVHQSGEEQSSFSSSHNKDKISSHETEENALPEAEKEQVVPKGKKEQTNSKPSKDHTSSKPEKEHTSSKSERGHSKHEKEHINSKSDKELTNSKPETGHTSLNPEKGHTSFNPEKGHTSSKPEKEQQTASSKGYKKQFFRERKESASSSQDPEQLTPEKRKKGHKKGRDTCGTVSKEGKTTNDNRTEEEKAKSSEDVIESKSTEEKAEIKSGKEDMMKSSEKAEIKSLEEDMMKSSENAVTEKCQEEIVLNDVSTQEAAPIASIEEFGDEVTTQAREEGATNIWVEEVEIIDYVEVVAKDSYEATSASVYETETIKDTEEDTGEVKHCDEPGTDDISTEEVTKDCKDEAVKDKEEEVPAKDCDDSTTKVSDEVAKDCEEEVNKDLNEVTATKDCEDIATKDRQDETVNDCQTEVSNEMDEIAETKECKEETFKKEEVATKDCEEASNTEREEEPSPLNNCEDELEFADEKEVLKETDTKEEVTMKDKEKEETEKECEKELETKEKIDKEKTAKSLGCERKTDNVCTNHGCSETTKEPENKSVKDNEKQEKTTINDEGIQKNEEALLDQSSGHEVCQESADSKHCAVENTKETTSAGVSVRSRVEGGKKDAAAGRRGAVAGGGGGSKGDKRKGRKGKYLYHTALTDTETEESQEGRCSPPPLGEDTTDLPPLRRREDRMESGTKASSVGGEGAQEQEVGMCANCGNLAKMRCANCRQAFYCKRECQRDHWKNSHKDQCRPYQVLESPELGRYMVASRDLKSGDIILKDEPLVIGPKQITEPICLGCYKRVDGNYRCSKCTWPLCGPACEKSPDHQPECVVGAEIGSPIAIEDFDEPNHFYEVVFPLRCLTLKKRSPKKYEALMGLQSHYEDRKGTHVHSENQKSIVSILRVYFMIQQFPIEEIDNSEKSIHTMTGIIDTNALELRLAETEVLGLYANFAMLEHSCTPNTKHTFNDARQVTVRAAVDIKRGEHISTMYTHVLWGTAQRRDHLKHSKYFMCTCFRCADPTELGTHFSALRCIRCASGFMLSAAPLDEMATWICTSCNETMTAEEVKEINLKLGEEVEAAVAMPTVKGLEEIIQRHSKRTVHPNHFHLFSARHTLLQMYGRDPSTQSEDSMKKKERMCQDFLKVCTALDPGMARLAPYAGVALYEYHLAVLSRARHDPHAQVVDTVALRKDVETAKALLQQCIRVLQDEPADQPEGQLCHVAQQNLTELRQWEATLSTP